MRCSKCGKENNEQAQFCSNCGIVLEVPKQKSQKGGKFTAPIAVLVAVTVFLMGVAGGMLVLHFGNDSSKKTAQVIESEVQPTEQLGTELGEVTTQERPQLINLSAGTTSTEIEASVTSYVASSGLTNVINADRFYLTDEQMKKLEENLFVVKKSHDNEFFEQYEYNRYAQLPNFVTVDSMMHTYHLYFSLLLNRTEKNYLADDLLGLSQSMLSSSMDQYEALVGTQWEEAAAKNVAFFSVAVQLQDAGESAPDYVASIVKQELDAIYAAEGVDTSIVTDEFLDYSQFKPRGYYEGDTVLEQYFRAMMWYGQINYAQSEDALNRSALLMTLAMSGDNLEQWEAIYLVTACFAGVSDDLSYYEYAPAIEMAYGDVPTMEQLVQNTEAYDSFCQIIKSTEPPAINSVPVYASEYDDVAEAKKGFRFMGQRFTIDAAIMQQLVYSKVGPNSEGAPRMFPDALDVPAALGSDQALELLEQQGDLDYEGYTENMQKIRDSIQTASESSWSTSLYSSWLYTLEPLLTPKGEGYPSFMTSEEWQRKSLECYLGSFTELKHDTVLYAKQVMAEMGGGDMETYDDRGYVEPEVEVYRRFMTLAQQTCDGLKSYGLISTEDEENLGRLEELAQQLMTISEKELRNESLTDVEFELIRNYGGTLEHFWIEAVKDKSESSVLDAKEIPASLVTDIATDPNGSVLQVATGYPSEILVIVPVDGELRLASGVVFDFYQFEQPISERLTDTEWRQMIGQWQEADGTYNWDAQVEKPWWTESYWAK